MEYKLSPSSLNLLEDCPRCFWLSLVKNIKRPSGPMSSIPIKMDSIIKHYFNRYRDIGQLPPMIEDKVTGWLAVGMPKTLKSELDNGITLWGRPDDYLKLKDGNIVPFDHKTKSKEPDTVHSSYQVQLNVYSYLLRAMGYDTINKGYLAYYCPDECDLHEGMPFHCKILEVKTNPDRTKKLLEKAYNVLKGEMPESGENCEYYKWRDESQNIL